MGRLFKEMNNNRGIILVVFPFLLLGILGVAALAIDLGNLGQLQNVVTRAADAGTVAALKYRAQVGWTEVNTNFSGAANGDVPILEEAYRATRANLVLAGIVPNDADRTTGRTGAWNNGISGIRIIGREYNPNGDDSVRVLIQYRGMESEAISVIVAVRADLLLAHALYEGVGRNTVISNLPVPRQLGPNAANIVPTGELKPVDVQLILDASNSMSCPIEGGCECAKSEAGCGTELSRVGIADSTPVINGMLGVSPQVRYFPREARLRDAALNFTRLFNPHRDRIGVHAFQTTAITLKSINDAECRGLMPGGMTFRRFCPRRMSNIFQSRDETNFGLIPSGNTNIMDGFQRAWEDYQLIPANMRNRDTFWVLFSDGAPTAGRFSYANAIRDISNKPGENFCPTNEVNISAMFQAGSNWSCLPQNPRNSRGYDYYHYAIEWPQVNNGAYTAPGVLVRAGNRTITETANIRACQDANLTIPQIQCYWAVKKACGSSSCSFSPTGKSECRGVGFANSRLLLSYDSCLRATEEAPVRETNEQWLPYGYASASPDNLRRGAVPWCSQLSQVTTAVESGPGSLREAEEAALGNCLNDLSYAIPHFTGNKLYAEGVEPESLNWKREYYHGAIAWSDAVRSAANSQRRSAVYVIGLGQPIRACNRRDSAESDLIPEGILDPYQCIEEEGQSGSRDFYHNFARKDVLLARLARDTDLLENMPRFAYPGNPDCAKINNRGECESAGNWNVPSRSSDGRYVFTSDPESLRNRFSFVGRSILLRVLDGQ